MLKVRNKLNKLYWYINYIWRLLMTGVCFSAFGIGAIFLVYVVIPIIGRNRAQLAINVAFRFFAFMVQALGVMRFEFKEFEKLQGKSGCIIVSNHPTLLDYVLIVSKLKKCNTIVKEALWQNIFLKKIVQLAGYIPNREFDEVFVSIRNSLRLGENVLIFPEGTRTTPHYPLKLKRGAAQLAIRLGVPIMIIKISCQPSTLTKSNKWYNIPKTKPLIALEVKELVDSGRFLLDTNVHSVAARRLTNYLQDILLANGISGSAQIDPSSLEFRLGGEE